MRSLFLLAALALTGGALGAPFLSSEVAFESVDREHFDAFSVTRTRAPPSDAPLVLRVALVGEPAGPAFTRAATWLAEHANVVLTESADGAPLFLTTRDLAATSGRGTLGATISRGMAVEVRRDDVGACVLAHEVLHFVGLKHLDDPSNMMYPHCSKDLLDRATLTEAQRDQLARVRTIDATTPRGFSTWASRTISEGSRTPE